MPDINEVVAADAALEALVDPTLSDVWRAMHGHDPEVVAAVAAQRALGGSLPEEWTVGPDGELTLDSIAEPVLTVKNSGGLEARLIVTDGSGADLVEVDIESSDDNDSAKVQISALGSVLAELAAGDDYGVLSLQNGDGSRHAKLAAEVDVNLATFNVGSGVTVLRVSQNGYLVIQRTAAPADAELEAGQAALWFDQTNGASKLKIKGKSADGTVVQGEVALS